MRKTLMIIATALAAAVMLVPATAQARHGSHHKASKADSNRDRIPDRWERKHHLSLKVKQTKRDQDRDGLNNLNEFKQGTNPRDADSDNDGMDDGDECHHGLNPKDRDSDDDGVRDENENAGKVTSFDASTGVLTIELVGGGSITGKVTGDTEIDCEQASTTTPTAQAAHDDGDREDSGDDDAEHSGSGDREGDNSGPGSGNEDHGDHGDDQNENGHEGNCSTADLTTGATVKEAELKATDAGAVFHEVKLVK